MGCVYKIFNREFVYYGSTKNFKQRMICHKTKCNNKNRPEYNRKLYKTIRANGGWDSFTKVIIEDNIETKQQWKERETYYIRNFKSNMNMVVYMTEEEYKERLKEEMKAYREKNKEKIKTYKKTWYQNNKEKLKAKAKSQYENNKEKIKAQKSKRIICECGRTIRQDGKAKHERTPTHINLVVAKLMEEYISQII